MMNFWLLLAVVVACGIVGVAHRYLSRSATIWLGVLLVVACGMALMLDNLSDLVRLLPVEQQSRTGQRLFTMGPEISVLGKSWDFFLIGLLCGFTLIIKGAFMKSVKQQNEDVDSRIDDVDDAVRIERELDERLAQIQKDLDPKELGMVDAIEKPWAVPGGKETKPTGNEKNIRNRYLHLARDFLSKTVSGLQKSVTDASTKLESIINTTATRPYEQIAYNKYNESRPTHTDHEISKMRDKIKRAKTALASFASKHNVSPDELEWPNGKVSTHDLIFWGLGFALAEFLANYWLLKGEIGPNQAIVAAIVAVFIILALSFVCACLLQPLRGKQKFWARAGCIASFIFLFVLFLLAFGTLLGYRDATAIDATAPKGVLDALKVIGNGYTSILGSTPNITVFLVNVIAFFLFGWKVMHWTDRYPNCKNLIAALVNARNDWEEFLQSHAVSVRESLDEANHKVNSNVKQATDAAVIIREKMGTLKNIRQIIGGLYTTKLHPAYSKGAQAYRKANATNRELSVDPVPEFWDSYPELCNVEDHFTADLGLEKCVEDNGEVLRNIDALLQSVRAAADEWQSNCTELGNEWNHAFEARIQRILTGGQ